jgi:hypothetical protein
MDHVGSLVVAFSRAQAFLTLFLEMRFKPQERSFWIVW